MKPCLRCQRLMLSQRGVVIPHTSSLRQKVPARHFQLCRYTGVDFTVRFLSYRGHVPSESSAMVDIDLWYTRIPWDTICCCRSSFVSQNNEQPDFQRELAAATGWDLILLYAASAPWSVWLDVSENPQQCLSARRIKALEAYREMLQRKTEPIDLFQAALFLGSGKEACRRITSEVL